MSKYAFVRKAGQSKRSEKQAETRQRSLHSPRSVSLGEEIATTLYGARLSVEIFQNPQSLFPFPVHPAE